MTQSEKCPSHLGTLLALAEETSLLWVGDRLCFGSKDDPINFVCFLKIREYNALTMDDLEFVQRCVKGDKQAWDEFLRKYSRLIYNYIHNVLNAKGYPFAQSHINDIFQEIFCSLIKDDFKKLRSFKARNGCSLASWLRQVTINFTIDYIRKIKPAVSIDEETDDELSLKDLLADDSVSVTDTLSQEERIKSLKECIERLGSDDKYFLELHINRGLRLEKLKDYFKRSRGAIDMQKSRLIDKLRECFKTKGFLLDF